MDPDGFRDRNHRFSYLVACENAQRIAEDRRVLDAGADHLRRFSAGDPRQRDGYALWSALLAAGPAAVIERLTERTPRGDYARETAPSFGGLPPRTRVALLRRARLDAVSGDWD